MEDLQLTETEQRYFADLFLCCDTDNSGKIPMYKASELFLSGNVPLDILKQITDMTGIGRSTHLSRSQFYSALKLVAAFQAGITPHPDLVNNSMNVPLPHFSWTSSSGDNWNSPPNNRQIDNSPDLIQLSDSDRTPVTQIEKSLTTVSSDGESETVPELPRTNGVRLSIPDGAQVVPVATTKRVSPDASSTASDSPTPTNSIQERNWAAGHTWQGLVCEEQRQLLGTEEESSDRHSSEEDVEGDVWTINDEQREYYTAQFRSIQPDVNGLIAGSKARLFFEKSRLPVKELRKIWQLADVTKDGALSLSEFNTAMHLVVLRRNNIALPDSLPSCLIPVPSANAGERVEVAAVESSPNLSPTAEQLSSKDIRRWTKFVDSPTNSVSSPGPKPVGNFDFHKSAVEQDPKIFHPVPLRVTPESQALGPGEEENSRSSPRRLTEPQPIPYEQLGMDAMVSSPKKTVTSSVSLDGTGDIRPIQRPQPKKPAAPGPGAIPPPPQMTTAINSVEDNCVAQTSCSSGPASLPVVSVQKGLLKKEPPPPPPPRPYRTHARSSSLDLNKLGKSNILLGAPPVVPPRISPSTTSPKKLVGQRSEGDVLSLVGHQTTFADFAHFGDEGESCTDSSQPRKHGAFDVYRKPANRVGNSEALPDVAAEDDSSVEDVPQLIHRHEPLPIKPKDHPALSHLQEQNSLLLRVCQQLGRELAEIQEERISLELQLEKLRAPTPE